MAFDQSYFFVPLAANEGPFATISLPIESRQPAVGMLTRGAQSLGEHCEAQQGRHAQRGEKDKGTTSDHDSYFLPGINVRASRCRNGARETDKSPQFQAR
jgi:hypothetical protein